MATQTALITGASGGIGKEFAKLFAADKINVVLVARSEEKLISLKNELEKAYGITAIVVAKDLSAEGSPVEIYQKLKLNNIKIDYLINNAGIGLFGKFSETNWGIEEKMIHLNILALTQLTKIYVKEMVSNKSGKILNVASTAAFQPGPLMAVYYASKAYVLSFSEALSNELKGTGVTSTVLCPGPTESGFLDAADLGDSNLFKRFKPPSSATVAQFGYSAMMADEVTAIQGMINKVLVQSVRLMPRKVITEIVRRFQAKV